MRHVAGPRLSSTAGLADSSAVHMLSTIPFVHPDFERASLDLQCSHTSRMDLIDDCDSEFAMLAIKKRADAARRQQKSRSGRLQQSVKGGSIISIPGSLTLQPFPNQCCSACGCHHARGSSCPCVRCHARHAIGSVCLDVFALSYMPTSNRNCSACGCLHNSGSPCPCMMFLYISPGI